MAGCGVGAVPQEPSVCVGAGAPVTGLKVKTVPPPWEDRRHWSGRPEAVGPEPQALPVLLPACSWL